jgi:hypothetical protein
MKLTGDMKSANKNGRTHHVFEVTNTGSKKYVESYQTYAEARNCADKYADPLVFDEYGNPAGYRNKRERAAREAD